MRANREDQGVRTPANCQSGAGTRTEDREPGHAGGRAQGHSGPEGRASPTSTQREGSQEDAIRHHKPVGDWTVSLKV